MKRRTRAVVFQILIQKRFKFFILFILDNVNEVINMTKIDEGEYFVEFR